MPDLAQWKERVLALTPGADVDAIEANLWRVSPPYNVRRALGIHTLANGSVAMPEPVLADNFDEYERWAPRFDHWWAFVVDPGTHRLEGNARAVFEAVRHDPAIRKVLIVEPGSPRLGGANVTVVPTATQASTWYLFRSRTIFVTQGPRADIPHPLSGKSHRFVGLRRGTPLLSFGVTTKVGPDGDRKAHNEAVHDVDLTRAVVASSPAQRRAMRKALRSPSQPNIWVTGSPRTDLLLCPEESLAADLRAQLLILRRATRRPPARRLGAGASARRAFAARPRRGRPRLAAPLGRPARRRGRPALAGSDAAGRGVARPGPSSDQGCRPARAHAADLPRRRDAAARGRRPGVRLQQRPARLQRALPARPGLRPRPGRGGRRIPGSSTTSPTWWPGRSVAHRSELFGAWENLLAEPTAEQVAERARVRDLLHSYRDGRCGLRVARRVQATYLPKAWFPPNL